MPFVPILLVLFALFAVATPAAAQNAANAPETVAGTVEARGKGIRRAWLDAPTTRYRHFARGNSVEAGGLRVQLADGRILTLMLDADHVFEDQGPRLADLDGDGQEEIVLVLASLTRGASLAVYRVAGDAILLLARTPFIGRPNRWLNPAGIADFDGDGRLEIALVRMPHLERRLELWRLDDGSLRQVMTLEDVANHRLGASQTGLSAVADFDGDSIADLAIPGGDLTTLRILGFAGGTPYELRRIRLPAPADGDFSLTGGPRLTIPLADGTDFTLAE